MKHAFAGSPLVHKLNGFAHTVPRTVLKAFRTSVRVHSSNASSIADSSAVKYTHGSKIPMAGILRLASSAPSINLDMVITCQLKLCTNWIETQEIFIALAHTFNHIHIATLVCHLPKVVDAATIPKSEQCDFEMFCLEVKEIAEQLLHQCRPRELANIAYGFAKMGIYSKRLMQLLVGRCMHLSLKGFNEQELSNLLWALTSLQHQLPRSFSSDFFDELGLRLTPGSSSRFKPSELSSIGHSFVRMSPPPPKHLVHQLSCYCQPLLPRFKGRALTNLIWAFAKLQYQPEQGWLRTFLSTAIKQLHDMEGQHMGQMSYALYMMQIVPPEAWVTSFLQHSVRRMQLLASEPQNLCMVLLMMSSLYPRKHKTQAAVSLPQPVPQQQLCSLTLHSDLIESILPAVCSTTIATLQAFSSKDLATVLLCFAHLDYQPPAEWMDAFQECVCKLGTSLNAQDLSNITWAFARLQYSPGQALLKVLLTQTVEQLSSMNAQNISNVLWALAKLHARPSRSWLLLIMQELASRHDDMIVLAAHVASIAWALPRLVPMALHSKFRVEAAQQLLQLEEASLKLLPSCTKLELLQVIVGFSQLGYMPSSAWQAAHASAMERIHLHSTASERMSVDVALAKLTSLPRSVKAGLSTRRTGATRRLVVTFPAPAKHSMDTEHTELAVC